MRAFETGFFCNARHTAVLTRQMIFKIGALKGVARIPQRDIEGNMLHAHDWRIRLCCVLGRRRLPLNPDTGFGQADGASGLRMPCANPFSIALNNFCKAMGFSRKSSAPILVASTAVLIVACPDIIMTGIVSWPCDAHSLSKVMPSVSGIQI